MPEDYRRAEDSQSQRTKNRRAGRWRRRRLLFLFSLVVLLLAVLSAPSFISHSPLGRSLVVRAAAGYGLDAQVDVVRMGWITPVHIEGLRIEGQQAGSVASVAQFNAELTVSDLLFGGATELGDVDIRGLDIQCSLSDGRCSLEDDLATLIQPGDSSSSVTGKVKIHDLSVTIVDLVSQAAWELSQSNAELKLDEKLISSEIAGVLVDADGNSGSLQASVSVAIDNEAQQAWQLTVEPQSLPLSVAEIVRRRFPSETSGLPPHFRGDASGAISIAASSSGAIASSVHALEIRNLTASFPTDPARSWSNALATINGDLLLQNERVVGDGLKATTDFGSVIFDGAFSSSMTLVGANDNPLMWLDALDGSADVRVDLAKLQTALPGVLPIRQGAEILSGNATATIQSSDNAGQRSRLVIHSDALRCRANGRRVVIEPIDLDATVVNSDGKIKAEKFKLTSSFASAVGHGTMRSGHADFDVDFGRLSAMIRPLVDLTDTRLGGLARGQVDWNAANDNVWRLSGNANATNLLLTMSGGKELRRPSLQSNVSAVGKWDGEALSELTSAMFTVTSNGMDFRAQLANPIQQPAKNNFAMPVKIHGTGRLETLAEVVGPWLPADLQYSEGGFRMDAIADVSSTSGQLTSMDIFLSDPRISIQSHVLQQPTLECQFQGQILFPSGDFVSRKLSLRGDSLTLDVAGEATAEKVDLDVAWAAKLDRLQGSLTKQRAPKIRPASFQTNQTSRKDWKLGGDCNGTITIQTHDHILDIQSETTGKNLTLTQSDAGSVHPSTQAVMPIGQAHRRSAQTVWYEPELKLNGLTQYDRKTGQIVADNMQLATQWLATTLSGNILVNDTQCDVRLKGPARFKMDQIGGRLSNLLGVEIAVEGIQETPIDITVSRADDQSLAFEFMGDLGWDSGKVAGVQLGAASIPIRVDQTTVTVQPTNVPVGQGQLTLAGEVFYQPGPIWIQVRPGTVARNIRMTPEMTSLWLKYLAPLAADATEVDGTFSAELDEAIVMIDSPDQSRVRGRLGIDGAEMRTGQMANQIISGIDQLKAIAKLRANEFGAAEPNVASKTLIRMPAQTVEFSFAGGTVQHQRLFFEIDRAQVVTGGKVQTSGNLDIVAQVPLDPRWLGSDLQDLANQVVALPISGTLSNPRLDASGIRDIVTQLGSQAVRQTAENYFEQQLNKQIDKIFGR